jgi:O-antigen/teichoic acid export membrane protein
VTESGADRGDPTPEQLATDAAAGRKLLTSTGALVASRLVVAVLGWAGTILIVRALTPQEWGQFSLVFTVLGTLSFVTSLGSGRIVLAELVRRSPGGGDYAGTYILMRLALGVVAYGCAVGFVALANYPPVVLQATVLGGVVLIIGAGGQLDVVFESALRLTPVALALVIGQVGQLALTVVIALTRPSLLLFVLPVIAFDLLAAGYKAYRVRSLLRLSFGIDLRLWWSILVQAAPLAAGGACVTIALSVDLLLLSKVDDFAAVGALAVADKFALVVVFVPQALEPPLVALLARAWPQRPAVFFATVRRGTLLMSLCAGLVLVGFLPVAGDLVTLLYGEQYARATLAAQLSVLAGCLQFYSYVLLGALIAQGRNRDFLLLSLVGLGTAVTASAIFVPILSVTGAGIARVVAALVTLAVFLGVARSRMGGRVADGRSHLLIALCCGGGLAVGFLGAGLLWWPAAAVVALVIYVVLLELTRVAGPAGLRSLLRDEPLDPVSGDAGNEVR